MRFAEAFPDDPSGDLLKPRLDLLGDLALHQWFVRHCEAAREAWLRLETLCSDPSMSLLTRCDDWITTWVDTGALTMGLDHVLRFLSDSQRLLVEQLIGDFAECGPRSRALAKSLFAERQLDLRHWADLLTMLDDGGGGTAHDSLRAWGSRHRYAGREAKPRMPVGRVVEKNAFVASLMTYAKLPRQVSRDTLADLTSLTRWEHARELCQRRGLQLGGDPMWATFDRDGKDPFAFSSGESQRGVFIRACLGLERSPALPRRYLPILLFRYRATRTCFIPTVADAANYTQWNIYFAPAIKDGYGLTQPWDDSGKSFKPRPEVIHTPESVSTLVGPIEEVR